MAFLLALGFVPGLLTGLLDALLQLIGAFTGGGGV